MKQTRVFEAATLALTKAARVPLALSGRRSASVGPDAGWATPLMHFPRWNWMKFDAR